MNKVAIITGATGGIGRAIASTLINAGIRTTLIARDDQKLADLNSLIQLNKTETLAFFVNADLSNEEEVIEAIKCSHEHWGKTDILINNAASCIATSFHNGSSADWKYMWQLNVLAPCVAIQESLKYFDNKNGGHIINISSTSAHRIVNGGSFYAATKFALRAASETLRKELVELKSNTRVSSISPGFVNTSFAKPENFITEDNVNKEKLDPDDIADAVLYILKTKPHVAIQDIILRSTKQYL